jgi:hypothetical protein
VSPENVGNNTTSQRDANSPSHLKPKSHDCSAAAPTRAINCNAGDSSLTEVTPIQLTHGSVEMNSPTRSVSASSRPVPLSDVKGGSRKG